MCLKPKEGPGAGDRLKKLMVDGINVIILRNFYRSCQKFVESEETYPRDPRTHTKMRGNALTAISVPLEAF